MNKRRKLPWPNFTYFNSNKHLTTPGKASIFLFIYSMIWLPLGINTITIEPLTQPIIIASVILIIFGAASALGSFYSFLCFIEDTLIKNAEKRLKEQKHKTWLEDRKK